MTNSRIERREFFRIEDRLFIEFRQIDPEESLALQKEQAPDSPSEHLQQVEFRPSSAFGKDDVYAYLEMLDRKLNMVIDLLSRKDQVFHGSYTDVVLSGSGLKYVSDVRLDAGVFVEIRLVLPFFSKPRIVAFGKVVRCERHPGEGKDAWDISVQFAVISEKDRDALIGYAFSKERESLRKEGVP